VWLAKGSAGAMLRKIIFAVIVLLIAVSAASADFIQNTYSIPSTDTFSGWTNTFNVQEFNPNLGTLTSLVLTFSGGITGTLTEYNNTTDGTLLGSANFSNTMTLREPDNTLLLSFKPLVGTGSHTVPGKGKYTWTNLSATGSAADNPASAAIQTLFTGYGSLALPVISSARQSAPTGDPNCTIDGQTMFSSADLTVLYNYDPVAPEPGTFGLLGLGLPLAGLWFRRRKRAK
jgi:hypothetical protein